MDKLTVNNDIFFAQTIEFLKAGKQVTIPVHGYSMMPTIRNLRDSVILEGVEGGTPEGAPRRKVRTGDIVLFRFHERYLLHRIIPMSLRYKEMASPAEESIATSTKFMRKPRPFCETAPGT